MDLRMEQLPQHGSFAANPVRNCGLIVTCGVVFTEYVVYGTQLVSLVISSRSWGMGSSPLLCSCAASAYLDVTVSPHATALGSVHASKPPHANV